MEQTGHRSLEGNKRTCDKQRIALSNILILISKKPRWDNLQESELKPKTCQVQGIEESPFIVIKPVLVQCHASTSRSCCIFIILASVLMIVLLYY